MDDCIFCKIVDKKIPCYNIYEDENFLAFLDVNPHAFGHTVVIPKNHVENIENLDEQKSAELLIVIKKVLRILKEKLKPDAFNIGWNDGKEAGQVVPHLHIHLLPRYSGDGGGSMHSIIKNPGDKSVAEVAELFKLN